VPAEIIKSLNPIDLDKVDIQEFNVWIGNNLVDIEQMELGLRQKDESILASVDGNIELRRGKIAGLHPILRLPAKVRVRMSMNGSRVEFSRSEIVLADTRMRFAGYISSTKVGVRAECKNVQIEKFVHYFLPQDTGNAIENLQGRAKVSVDISGEHGISGVLQVDGSGALKNVGAEYMWNNSKEKIEIVGANVVFSSPDMMNLQRYVCDISDADVRMKNFAAAANGKISNFEIPYIIVDANVSGGLSSVDDIFERGESRGSVHAEFVGKDFVVENLKAKLQISDAVANLQNRRYYLDGRVNVSLTDIIVPDMNFRCDAGEGVLKAKVHNYMSLRYNNPDEIVRISGDISANKIYADSIFNMFNFKSTTKNSKNSKNNMPQVKIKLDVRAEQLLVINDLYRKMSFMVQYNKDKLLIKNLVGNGFGGNIFGNASVMMTKQNSGLTGNIYFRDIQIDKISYLDKYFTSGSLLGRMSGSIDIKAPLGGKRWDVNKVNGHFNFRIEDGQMINFKPIEPLEKYVKREHLKDVHFLTLTNTLTIADGAVHIPQMEVRSSALNTYIEGTYYFNGDFNYHITLFFSELLRGKAQRLENPIKEGKTKVFLHATRKNGNFSMDYDTDISRKIKSSLQQEQTSLTKAKNKIRDKERDKDKQPSIAIEHEDIQQPPQKNHQNKSPDGKKKEESAVAIEWDDD
jgi:hypothetical protein